MENIGTKIRIERKKAGLTLEQLAKQIGVSPITLHRVETGKSNPSVVLLSEIAQDLNKSIYSFIQENKKTFIHIKKKSQRLMSSSGLRIKLIGPRNMITGNIIVTYGELTRGKRIDIHTNPGIEWTYITEGKCTFNLDAQDILLEEGDSVSYDARIEHAVTAIEKLKFLNIFLEDRE